MAEIDASSERPTWVAWVAQHVGGDPSRQQLAVEAALRSRAFGASPQEAVAAAMAAAVDPAPAPVAPAAWPAPVAAAPSQIAPGLAPPPAWDAVVPPEAGLPPAQRTVWDRLGVDRTSGLIAAVSVGGILIVLAFVGVTSLVHLGTPVARKSPAAPSSTPVAAPRQGLLGQLPSGPVAYSSALAKSDRSWLPLTGPDKFSRFEAGGFIMHGTEGDLAWVAPRDMPAKPAVVAEVTTAGVDGSTGPAGGPACIPGDLKSYYSFVVNAAGLYSVQAHPGGGGEVVLADWGPSSAVHQGLGANNRVAAACIPDKGGGVHLMMSVNGTTVFDEVETSAPSGPWRAGIASCWCLGSGGVRFQDVVEQGISST